MTQFIKCVYKVLLNYKNGKYIYIYEVINNNFNLPTYIRSVMT